MMIPVTALIAVPLLYAAWQRQKSRREALSNPAIPISAAAKRAMRLKDWATAGLFLFTAMSSGLAILEYPPQFWVPPAILAVVAFVVRSYWELVILRDLRSR
jgi:hypothetical protein